MAEVEIQENDSVTVEVDSSLKPSSALSQCVQCKEVTKKSQCVLTTCCNQCYCQDCVSKSPALKESGQCPSCGETEVDFMKHKEAPLEQNEESAAVALKENGHSSTVEENGHSSATSSVENGESEAVDLSHHPGENGVDNSESLFVQCTNHCGQEVEKQYLSTHLESECPKRDFVCPHCSLVATYDTITGEHSLHCSSESVSSPNSCGATVAHSAAQEHLNACPAQDTQHEFNSIDSNAERRKHEEHMQSNTEAHQTLMAATLETLKEFQEKQLSVFDQKLQQSRTETERRLREQQDHFETRLHEEQDKFKRMLKRQQTEFEQKLKEERERHSHLETALQAKEQTIQETRTVLNHLQEQLNMVVLRSPPYQFTMTSFKQLKTDNRAWNSLPMYTHPGGYKVSVRVRPNGLPWSRGFKTHMSVWFFAMKGDYDESLVWPAEATITLQLINQHHDKKHLTVTRRYHWRKDVVGTANHTAIGVILDKWISHEDLELNTQEETQFLKDNCLRFRITEIIVH